MEDMYLQRRLENDCQHIMLPRLNKHPIITTENSVSISSHLKWIIDIIGKRFRQFCTNGQFCTIKKHIRNSPHLQSNVRVYRLKL
ncbi:hypothetical protein OUZ56_023256 [Daphnia magna]|uniref:Uncharacterized protein n=1 Tax=Daphnia magna TaxID=35525 RepID=A0ABR0AYQ7_9CRUS|nr:hypothetical protein OUZ56_023256 [Daphnia magna]